MKFSVIALMNTVKPEIFVVCIFALELLIRTFADRILCSKF